MLIDYGMLWVRVVCVRRHFQDLGAYCWITKFPRVTTIVCPLYVKWDCIREVLQLTAKSPKHVIPTSFHSVYGHACSFGNFPSSSKNIIDIVHVNI